MKYPVQKESFAEIKGVGNVEISPDGKKVAYGIRQIKKDLSGYENEVFLYDAESGENCPLKVSADSILWRNEAQLVLINAYQDIVCIHTKFSIYNLETGEYAKEISLPLREVQLLGMRDADTLIAVGVKDLKLEKRLEKLDKEAYEQEVKEILSEREAYYEFDEFPFCFDARGVVDGLRRNVYRIDLNTGNCEACFPEGFRVVCAAYSAEDSMIAVSALENTKVQLYKDKEAVYVTDDRGGTFRQLVSKDTFCITQLEIFAHKLFLRVDAEIPRSLRNTPYRMIFMDPISGACEDSPVEPPSFLNLISSDVQLSIGHAMKAAGERLYCIVNREEDSILARISSDFTVEYLTDGCGCISAFDLRENQIFCSAMQDGGLPELYEVKDGRMICRSTHNAAYEEKYDYSAPLPLHFTAADGVEVHGFVIPPLRRMEGERYPLILNVHGGPGICFGHAYMHEMQYLSAQGYYIAYCNPRGSCGRGAAFEYVFERFGTDDYSDLMQFVDEVLMAFADIDPKRIGVTGASYGGFMTNWIIGHTNRFAAAISQNSISNLMTMNGISDCSGYLCEEWSGATPQTNMELVCKFSPITYAHRAVTPTLFLQNTEDFRCPVEEAEQMFTTLLHHGTEAKLCVFKGESHGISRKGKPVNRIYRLSLIREWMDRFLKALER